MGLPSFLKRNNVLDDATSALMSLTGRHGTRRDTTDQVVMGSLAASACNNRLFGVHGVYKAPEYYHWLSHFPKIEVRVCTLEMFEENLQESGT